jgi:hypothetical protein
LLILLSVLHPYFKDEWFKLRWGGAKEQAEEYANGNFEAKNWQDEARKVIETMVCPRST